MTADEKYIVFKRSDFTPEFAKYLLSMKQFPTPLEDAVVIRTQDIFAAGGLSAYSHSIRAYLGGAQMYLPEGMMQQLLEVADYFASVAQEAEDRLVRGECKVPD